MPTLPPGAERKVWHIAVGWRGNVITSTRSATINSAKRRCVKRRKAPNWATLAARGYQIMQVTYRRMPFIGPILHPLGTFTETGGFPRRERDYRKPYEWDRPVRHPWADWEPMDGDRRDDRGRRMGKDRSGAAHQRRPTAGRGLHLPPATD